MQNVVHYAIMPVCVRKACTLKCWCRMTALLLFSLLWQGWQIGNGGRREWRIWESDLQRRLYSPVHTYTHIWSLYFILGQSIWFYHWTLQWQINVFLTINRFVDLGKKHHPRGLDHPFVKLWLFLQRHLYMRTHGTMRWLKWKAMMTGTNTINADEMLVVFKNNSENVGDHHNHVIMCHK